MELEAYFELLASDDIRIKGTRIGIETVLYDHIHRGRTPEQIAASYPSLTLDQVYATILYYLRNQPTVEAYLTDWLEHAHQMRVQQAQDPRFQDFANRMDQARQELAGQSAPATVGERA